MLKSSQHKSLKICHKLVMESLVTSLRFSQASPVLKSVIFQAQDRYLSSLYPTPMPETEAGSSNTSLLSEHQGQILTRDREGCGSIGTPNPFAKCERTIWSKQLGSIRCKHIIIRWQHLSQVKARFLWLLENIFSSIKTQRAKSGTSATFKLMEPLALLCQAGSFECSLKTFICSECSF